MSGTLFVGDVHGCADALDRLLDEVRPDRVILTGDLFTKGPDPRGVWELVQAWQAEAVLGNHDVRVLERWKAGRDLPKPAMRWLAERPWRLEGPGWLAVHAAIEPGSPHRTRRPVAVGLVERGRWWTRWRGDRLVIHGHHARHGLVDNRPWSLGLDTGCARTGLLTGYVLEDDALVQVRQVAAA
ncbi:MAG: metallophosphoesterase [Alphaproteobacteria bacterium]|nr:metallophosphoesterase [Alphaproteobacteria bacterium]